MTRPTTEECARDMRERVEKARRLMCLIDPKIQHEEQDRIDRDREILRRVEEHPKLVEALGTAACNLDGEGLYEEAAACHKLLAEIDATGEQAQGEEEPGQ